MNKIKMYKEMAPDEYGLIDYDIQEIVHKLPKITKDLELLWDLLLRAYGRECFTPMIIKKFPNQFKADKDSTGAHIKAIRNTVSKEIDHAVSACEKQMTSLRWKLDDAKTEIRMQEADQVMMKE